MSAPRPWKPWQKGAVPREWRGDARLEGYAQRGYLAGVERTWGNEWFAVMARPVETSWGTIEHVLIRNLPNTPVRDWYDLMRIKDELFGVDRVAIEVYPPSADVVDGANMTHLWVLPAGFALPFGLTPEAMHGDLPKVHA